MIELHFHCLPGVDDGPADWDEAVALCRAAAAEGTTQIVATPHVLRANWINDDVALRDELVVRLNAMLGGQPAVLPGCEYFFSTDALALLDRGETGPLTGLNRSRYLLVEIPPETALSSAEAVFHEFRLGGLTPVIAHPERHAGFRSEPERLERLVSRGALCQVTAGSLLGDFGARAAEACDELFGRGLIHFVASDAHNLGPRRPRLAAAREHVRRRWGGEVESALFEANPEALIASATIPWRPRPSLTIG
ncbi:MAG TPA: CpsB/CapC family capsule biosynthesis tyrosine phosphatase [Thermoanaerobaculia bacterium]